MVEVFYNRIVLWYAKSLAKQSHKLDNRTYYVLDIFNSYIVLNSKEKDAVNKGMAKSNRMNIEQMLRATVFKTA